MLDYRDIDLSRLKLNLQRPEVVFNIIGRQGDAPTFRIGFDVARFGVDHNCIWIRHDDWLISGCRWSGMDGVENAAILTKIIHDMEELGWICEWACVDVIGPGGTVCDTLWHKGPRFREITKPINVAYASSEPERFQRVRSEVAWNMRQRIRTRRCWVMGEKRFPGLPKGVAVDQVMIEKFRHQASTLQYSADRFIDIETKKKYKERMTQERGDGTSPDEFDAGCLAFNDKLVGLERRPSKKRLASIIGR